MRRIGVAAVALLLVTSFVVPTFAKPFSRVVSLSFPTMVGNTQLVAGDYQVTVIGHNVALVRDHQLITQVNGRWQDVRGTYGATAIISDPSGQLREIRFQDTSRALIISTPY
jgi:hypothetical protein